MGRHPLTFSVTEHFLSETGTYYKVSDLRAGWPTLVFIHGLSGSSSAWREYEQAFDHKYNLMVCDLRGHGRSKKFPHTADYLIGLLADDIEKIAARFSLGPFIIIGHSFGATVALDYISRYQSRVRAAVFLSPSFRTRNVGWMRPFMGTLDLVGKLLEPFGVRSAAGRQLDYTKYVRTGDWNLRRIFADVGNTTVRVYLKCLTQIYHYDGEPLLPALRIPVLIIHGKRDTMAPLRFALAAAKQIKDCRSVILPDANHIAILNNFPEVRTAIERFVDQGN